MRLIKEPTFLDGAKRPAKIVPKRATDGVWIASCTTRRNWTILSYIQPVISGLALVGIGSPLFLLAGPISGIKIALAKSIERNRDRDSASDGGPNG